MISNITILIVDDNPDFCSSLADIVHSLKWKSIICNSPEQALGVLEKNASTIALMLLDIEFSTSALTGIDMLALSVRSYPTIPVIMISGKGTIENAVKSTKLGAVNFIEKNVLSSDRLREVLLSTVEKLNGQRENQELLSIIHQQGIVGRSKAMAGVADKIMRFGKTDLNVLITGETGTGKKLVARALHAVSRRNKYSMVTVDIPNIPRELFQSELFGHVRGAFSGALENKKGLFHQANRGTLFLDEIGDLSPELQANLLLPIEERIVRRVGSVEPEQVDLRFISATDKDLVQAMKEGEFREQLYHRLRECEVHLPSLADRKEDIPLIVEHYVQDHNKRMEEQKGFAPAAIEYMQEHSWNGNVRELLSTIRVVLQTSSSDWIEVADLHKTITTPSNGKNAQQLQQSNSNAGFEFSSDRSLKDDIAIVDKLKIESTLGTCKGNVSKAAAMLGISRETLHNKIRRYGINTHEYRSR